MKPELLEGELLCDKCNGTGSAPVKDYMLRCPKCLGTGKLDWIENARGGKVAPISPSSFFIDSSSFTSFSNTIEFDTENIKVKGKSLKDYITDVMASQLAEKIDKMIYEQLSEKYGSVLGTQMKKENV
jgi:hypothetical protein